MSYYKAPLLERLFDKFRGTLCRRCLACHRERERQRHYMKMSGV